MYGQETQNYLAKHQIFQSEVGVLSQAQNIRKTLPFLTVLLLFKLPILWYFTIATWTDQV